MLESILSHLQVVLREKLLSTVRRVKKRLSAKIDGARSRALRGATGVKNGVKSGGFWLPLSQDVALYW